MEVLNVIDTLNHISHHPILIVVGTMVEVMVVGTKMKEITEIIMEEKDITKEVVTMILEIGVIDELLKIIENMILLIVPIVLLIQI